jgi:DNA-binding transcriptional LysR family regulator
VPDLRALRTFLAVAEERNFTRAAERLHLAQQAVSKSVQGLERELGVALLERTTRDVRLTEAGEALLESGREALRAAEDAFARARAVGGGLAGRVRVGVSPAVGAEQRDEIVGVLRDGAPDLAVSVHEVRPGEIEAELRDRRLDLVLARTARTSPAIDSAALRPTPADLYVAAGHRLATAERPVPLAALDGERLLVWSPPGTPFTDLLLRRLAAAGARVEPVEARVTGGGDMGEVAANGAVGLAPRGRAAGDGVVALPLADAVTLPLLVLWPAGAPSPAVARVRAAMSS